MFMVWTIDPALSERMQEHVVRANLHMQASGLLAGIERVLSSRFFGYSDGLSTPGAMLDVASKTERFILSVPKDYVCAYLPERGSVMYPEHTSAETKVRVAEFELLLQGYQSAMRSYHEWGLRLYESLGWETLATVFWIESCVLNGWVWKFVLLRRRWGLPPLCLFSLLLLFLVSL